MNEWHGGKRERLPRIRTAVLLTIRTLARAEIPVLAAAVAKRRVAARAHNVQTPVDPLHHVLAPGTRLPPFLLGQLLDGLGRLVLLAEPARMRRLSAMPTGSVPAAALFGDLAGPSTTSCNVALDVFWQDEGCARGRGAVDGVFGGHFQEHHVVGKRGVCVQVHHVCALRRQVFAAAFEGFAVFDGVGEAGYQTVVAVSMFGQCLFLLLGLSGFSFLVVLCGAGHHQVVTVLFVAAADTLHDVVLLP